MKPIHKNSRENNTATTTKPENKAREERLPSLKKIYVKATAADIFRYEVLSRQPSEIKRCVEEVRE